MPHLSSEFQVSTFSRFKVIAISASGGRKTANFTQKKNRDFRREMSQNSQLENLEYGQLQSSEGSSSKIKAPPSFPRKWRINVDES